MAIKSNIRTNLLFVAFFCLLISPQPSWSWSWNSADNVLPSLREELDKEIAAYRLQVGNGMSLQDRIIALDRLIGNYQPLGLNMVELETERSRLMLQEKQRQLRTAELQTEATALYDRGVAEFGDGQYRVAVETFQEAERLLPDDTGIKEIRRKLQNIVPIVESEVSTTGDGKLIRLAMSRYLENDPRRALNALIYAQMRYKERREVDRLKNLIVTDHPELEVPHLASGITLVDHKLQLSLEAIYEGRYLTAISECTDVLDLEPTSVLALTRLGSAYYAMNEQNKAQQVWTKALQLDPNNDVLRKFLYGRKGAPRVEKTQ